MHVRRQCIFQELREMFVVIVVGYGEYRVIWFRAGSMGSSVFAQERCFHNGPECECRRDLIWFRV